RRAGVLRLGGLAELGDHGVALLDLAPDRLSGLVGEQLERDGVHGCDRRSLEQTRDGGRGGPAALQDGRELLEPGGERAGDAIAHRPAVSPPQRTFLVVPGTHAGFARASLCGVFARAEQRRATAQRRRSFRTSPQSWTRAMAWADTRTPR